MLLFWPSALPRLAPAVQLGWVRTDLGVSQGRHPLLLPLLHSHPLLLGGEHAGQQKIDGGPRERLAPRIQRRVHHKCRRIHRHTNRSFSLLFSVYKLNLNNSYLIVKLFINSL